MYADFQNLKRFESRHPPKPNLSVADYWVRAWLAQNRVYIDVPTDNEFGLAITTRVKYDELAISELECVYDKITCEKAETLTICAKQCIFECSSLIENAQICHPQISFS